MHAHHNTRYVPSGASHYSAVWKHRMLQHNAMQDRLVPEHNIVKGPKDTLF